MTALIAVLGRLEPAARSRHDPGVGNDMTLPRLLAVGAFVCPNRIHSSRSSIFVTTMRF
jgi:hypothetical protein